MLKYSMSRREKALVLILAIIAIVVAWYMLVFQGTSEQITKLDGELSTIQSQITIDQTRVSQLDKMKEAIAERKAEGARPVEVPTYDNIKPLMAELNVIMSAAGTYTLTFDDIDQSDAKYVARGVRIDYSVGSYAEAENIMQRLTSGSFPCSIDSFSIVDSTVTGSGSGRGSGNNPVTASVHVTFIEKVSA